MFSRRFGASGHSPNSWRKARHDALLATVHPQCRRSTAASISAKSFGDSSGKCSRARDASAAGCPADGFEVGARSFPESANRPCLAVGPLRPRRIGSDESASTWPALRVSRSPEARGPPALPVPSSAAERCISRACSVNMIGRRVRR